METVTITLEIIDGPNYSTDDDGWEHNAYTVKLQRDDKSMTIPWRQGLGITDDPNAADVLDCLLSDAAGVENARGDFLVWASEYGYNEDSRKAEAMFRAVTEQTDSLRTFLGNDFDSAVFPDGESSDEVAARLTA